MRNTYQPKHMKPRTTGGTMKVPGKKAAATLTLAAMLGSQALTPLTALAATTEDVDSGAGKVTVGTSFSNATQRLIAAADGTLALTAAEAKALLAESRPLRMRLVLRTSRPRPTPAPPRRLPTMPTTMPTRPTPT